MHLRNAYLFDIKFVFYQQERRNERFTDLILRGDGLKKASVGREAVFTINSKQAIIYTNII